MRLERPPEAGAVEDVVAEHKSHRLVADEVGADHEGLGKTLRPRLHGVLDAHAQVGSVAEQLTELLLVLRGRDDQDLADAGHHQRGERVVDHRLVVHRHDLLADAASDRVEPCSRSAGQNDPSHDRGGYPRGCETPMTRWLVAGAGGMLGRDLVSVLSSAGDDVVGLARNDLDIRDLTACRAAVDGFDVVVNAAAWTDVDGAEGNETEAFAVNAVGSSQPGPCECC